MATTTMAIVVLIPGRLGRRLNELRRKLDPDGHAALPVHIPLVRSFRARPSFLPLEQHCWQVCHNIAPFSVGLGCLVPDEDVGVTHVEIVAGGERLMALRGALLTGKYAPPGLGAPHEPRAVVGRLAYRDELAITQWEEAASKLNLSFLMERIGLMAQYPDGTWYERDFYTLDRAVTRA